ncbi:hypothetical protein [Lactobacillus sp. M0390]|nr:hypothetical protein [Lactobacillus sp. M0390]MBH9985840.1 hypothetical protein [Lactobacillus sp. M0390]
MLKYVKHVLLKLPKNQRNSQAQLTEEVMLVAKRLMELKMTNMVPD